MKLGLSSTTRQPVRIEAAPSSTEQPTAIDETIAPASQVVVSEEIRTTKKRSKKKRLPRP